MPARGLTPIHYSHTQTHAATTVNQLCPVVLGLHQGTHMHVLTHRHLTKRVDLSQDAKQHLTPLAAAARTRTAAVSGPSRYLVSLRRTVNITVTHRSKPRTVTYRD
jgi:hypothetical protein